MTGQSRHPVMVSLLDGSSLDTNCYGHVGGCSILVHHGERPGQVYFTVTGCSIILPSLYLTLWLLNDVCSANRNSFAFYQAVAGTTKVYTKKSTSNVGKNWQVCVLERAFHTRSFLHLNYLIS